MVVMPESTAEFRRMHSEAATTPRAERGALATLPPSHVLPARRETLLVGSPVQIARRQSGLLPICP